MKSTVFALAVIFAGIGFLLSGAQTMTGYYAEPSGYGFYHIWFANMYISLSGILLGSVAMVFIIRKMERRLF